MSRDGRGQVWHRLRHARRCFGGSSPWAVAAATLAGGLWSAAYIRRELISINYVSAPVTLGLLGVASLSLALGWPVARSLLAARAAVRSAADISALRAHVLKSKNWALCTAGYALAAGFVFLFALFIAVNHFAVGETFFDLGLIRDTAPLVLTAFQYNIEIFLSAEVLILVWGLLIALARMAPGPAGLPVRTMATIYCDCAAAGVASSRGASGKRGWFPLARPSLLAIYRQSGSRCWR